MKIGKKTALIAMISLLQAGAVMAQSKFNVVLDYHYNLGIKQRYNGSSFGRDQYKMSGNSLHLTALYHATPRISAGIGIGADRYEGPEFNTFPIYGAFRYRPLKNFLNAYVYTNLGYSVFENKHIASGLMWDAGIGYTKMFRKHFGLNFQLGYNLKQFRNVPGYEYDWDKQELIYLGKKSCFRNSISFGAGLVF